MTVVQTGPDQETGLGQMGGNGGVKVSCVTQSPSPMLQYVRTAGAAMVKLYSILNNIYPPESFCSTEEVGIPPRRATTFFLTGFQARYHACRCFSTKSLRGLRGPSVSPRSAYSASTIVAFWYWHLLWQNEDCNPTRVHSNTASFRKPITNCYGIAWIGHQVPPIPQR